MNTKDPTMTGTMGYLSDGFKRQPYTLAERQCVHDLHEEPVPLLEPV